MSFPSIARSRRAALLTGIPVACFVTACNAAPIAGTHASWASGNAFVATTTQTTTCRFVAVLSGSGTQLRVEFSDPLNGSGFTVKAASVAAAASPSSLDVTAGTSFALTFGRAGSVVVPAGGTDVVSDPVGIPVAPGKAVAVTVVGSAGDAGPRTEAPEPAGCVTGTLTKAATAPGSAFTTNAKTHWVSGIRVDGPAQESLLVLGDSISARSYQDGYGPYRWPDMLRPSGASLANDSVSGGEISQPGIGGSPDGLTRLKHLLQEPYPTWLLVEQGTNDLAAGVSADTLLTKLSQAADLGTAQTLNTVVATIAPRAGNSGWTASQESARQQVNATLRSGTWASSRGVTILDLDTLLQDPANPTALNPAYDSGDHLHPNAAGDHVIAGAVAQLVGLPGVS